MLLPVILVTLLLSSQSPILAETNSSLEQAQKEINGEQNRIADLSDQEKALLSDLVALESQLQQNNQELSGLQERLQKTQSDLHKIQTSVRNKEENLKRKNGILRDRLTDIYTGSRFINFDFIFSSKDIAALLSRLDYLNVIAKQDARLVQKVKSEKLYLEQSKERIEQENRSLMRIELTCRAKQEELDEKVDEKKALLGNIKEDRLASEESLGNLQEKAVKIRTEMNRLQPPSRGVSRGSIRMLATAYCPCSRCCGSNSGSTATGLPAGKGVVAVDPRVIPLGTRLYISEYGEAIAGDTGGSIVGQRIDLGFNSHSEALAWGKGWVVVEVIE